MRKKRRNQYTVQERQQAQEEFLACYEKTLGVLTPAAKAAGVNPSTVWRWKQEFPEFAQRCEEIEEIAVDFVETKLYNLINEGSEACTIFYMKTRGRHRGYSEKQQLDVNAEVKGVTVNVTSPETAQVLQDIMDKEQ